MKKVLENINKSREFVDSELINNKGKNISINNYTVAQRLNTYEQTNRYGKVVPILMGNTKTGYQISKLPQHNFGSIGEYKVDTLPNSFITVKGVEKTEVISEMTTHNGQQIISRRFICNLISTWGYITGLQYKNALKMWAKDISQRIYNGRYKEYKMVSGEQAVSIIKDMLFLIRNKSFDNIIENLGRGIISEQLYSVINSILTDTTLDKKQIQQKVMAIKNKLYYSYDKNGYAWAFPKYNVEYLIGLIKQLQSGQYYNEMFVPVINNLKKYPIKCKDTHLKPMTDEQHIKNRDDYDIGQYIWEDY